MTEPDIQALLQKTPSHERGAQALAWAQEQQGKAVRGDLMLGIMEQEEYELIPKALEYAGKSGISEAWLPLAQHYLTEWQNAEAAAALWQAIPTHPEAVLTLAKVQWFRLRDELSTDEAARTYQQLLEFSQKYPDESEAQYLLGLLTWGGFGTPASPEWAVSYHKHAADLGNADAQFELYVLYSTGQGVTHDSHQAHQFLEQAASQGQLRAMYNLGAYHATGQEGYPLDPQEAVRWYTRAAEAGHSRAASTLAIMYLTGNGIPVDRSEGEYFLDLAEDLGEDMTYLREVLDDDTE